MTYDFPTAFSLWDEREQSAIDRVMKSGRFTMGAECEQCEIEFAAWHGMKHAIMVNSGSSANLIAIAALCHKQGNPLQRGDRVIVPALAWATTYAPLIQHGLDLVLADCDATWCADPASVKGVENIRLVIGCPILGNPTHQFVWREFARSLDAYYMEDACESVGASVQGKLAGTQGLLNTFSFYWSHQISAIEGGMILTEDNEMNDLCRMLRDHGMTRWKKPQTFEAEYDFRLMGYNVRPLELHAAIAREQLKKLHDLIDARSRNYAYFKQVTNGMAIVHPKPNGKMSPFGLHFTVGSGDTRRRLAKSLRQNGIDCRLPTGGSFTQHAYGARWASHPTLLANNIHERGLFLGCPPWKAEEQIDKAVKIMGQVL